MVVILVCSLMITMAVFRTVEYDSEEEHKRRWEEAKYWH